MKTIITIFTFLSLGLRCVASDAMEQEFESRFRAFIDTADVSMDALNEVWLYGDTPSKVFLGTQKNLESIVFRGLGSLKIVDIYPMMLERIEGTVTLEGGEYVINLKPYKMLEVEYTEKIKGGSAGWSYVLGEQEGQLYMVGLKRL